MDYQAVYISDIIGEAVAKTNARLRADAESWLSINRKNINYVYGGRSHVIQKLKQAKDGEKYPMTALMMGFGTRRGDSGGYYGTTIIKELHFCALSDNLSLPPEKYEDHFKPLLFPMYHTFMDELCNHPMIVETDVDNISHEVWEYPADNTSETNTIFLDFLDILSIYNLQLTLNAPPSISCATIL